MPKVYIMIDDGFIRKFFDPRSSWVDEHDSKYHTKKYDLAEIKTSIQKKLANGDYRYKESEIRERGINYFRKHEKSGKFVGMVTVNLTLNIDNTIRSFDITQIELTDGMGFQWLLTRDGERFYDKRNKKPKFLWENQISKNSPLYKYQNNKNPLGIKKPSPKDKKQLLEEYIASLRERQRKSRYFSFCQLIDPEKVLLQLKKHIYEDSCGNRIGDIFEIAELLEIKLDVEPPSPSKEDNDNKKDGETNFYYQVMDFNSKYS